MQPTDLLALLPIMLPAVAAMAVLLLGSFVPRHGPLAAIAAAGLLGGLVAGVVLRPRVPLVSMGLLAFDGRAAFFWPLLLGAALAVVALAFGFLRARPVRGERHHREFYVLLLLATTGALTLAAAVHVAVMFVGLELLSLSLFGLLAYEAERERALEAGVKYMVLATLSSGFLLLGLALLYTVTGSLQLAPLPAAEPGSPYLLGGVVMVVVGLGFKMSLVPLHMWTPDVYEGAPAPVSAFIASVSKIAAAAWLLRFLETTEAWSLAPVALVLAVLAGASMLVGNLLALAQENLKRLLAYSSISHLGYLCLPLVAGGPLAGEAVAFYASAYVLMLLAAFGVVALLSEATPGHEVVQVRAYRGLFWRRPVPATVLAVALVSLAGIPLTAGFVAKFYVFAAGVQAALWWLLAALVIGSSVGLYFYLRVLVTLFVTGAAGRDRPVASLAGGVLVALFAAIVWLGVLPASLVQLVGAAP